MAAFTVFSSSAPPSPTQSLDLKTTCGSSSCAAVNPELPKCGESGPEGYQVPASKQTHFIDIKISKIETYLSLKWSLVLKAPFFSVLNV